MPQDRGVGACIYCGAPADAKEHWLPSGLGRFKGYEPLLDRLCTPCNETLGRDVDEEFLRTGEIGFQRATYTLAIHAGLNSDGQEHNPHAHLMISERQNDGIERTREAWFRRANSDDPARGGAPKSRTFHGREWMEHARERWASLVNSKLEELGRDERVDHRSYERQGRDDEPGHHYGPAAAYMAARGIDHDRLDDAAAATEASAPELQWIPRPGLRRLPPIQSID